MTDTARLRQTLIERIRDGAGTASRSERRAAFDNAELAEPLRALVQKVATEALAVADGDIAASRAAGFTEDQIFEIVACAAVGQSARQYEAAATALGLALRRE
jgi:alkylhydroperoxidase family enzyme